MSNKSVGNKFEKDFCMMLMDRDFWVHNMVQNSSGQPADLIAVRRGKAYLIDCKVCASNAFKLSRIEDNQHMAMSYWKDMKNGDGWFAIKFDSGDIYMISHDRLKTISQWKASATKEDVAFFGHPFERWVAKA